MKIKKFCHVDNGKTIYAVIGESDRFNALHIIFIQDL